LLVCTVEKKVSWTNGMRALPFITVGGDGKFKVHQEACEVMSAIQGKVAIVAGMIYGM
jgi:hypothetical protein